MVLTDEQRKLAEMLRSGLDGASDEQLDDFLGTYAKRAALAVAYLGGSK
jgi:hypothetical protein